MWLFHSRGFYSAVVKPQDVADGMITVRGRVKADLERLSDLLPDAKPYRIKHSDYPWRIRVRQVEWARACEQMALEVDWSNFKDAVTARQGKHRHDVYLRVWSVLHTLQDAPRRRRRTRREDESLQLGWNDDEFDKWRGGAL